MMQDYLDKVLRGGRLPTAFKDEGGSIKCRMNKIWKLNELPALFGDLYNLLGGRNGCYN
jgi:hypothetical protein